MTRLIEVGCRIHARRKFDEARSRDPERAHRVLAWVGRLDEIEEETKEVRRQHPEWDDATRHAHRLECGASPCQSSYAPSSPDGCVPTDANRGLDAGER